MKFPILFSFSIVSLLTLASCSTEPANLADGGIDSESLTEPLDTETDADTDSEHGDGGPTGCFAGELMLDEDGVGFAESCDGSSLGLFPFVEIDGRWLGGGENGDCEITGTSLGCPAGDKGTVFLEVDGSTLRLRFDAAVDAVVEGLFARGTVVLRGAEGWLSNGFQSWSQSGVIKIDNPPSPASLEKALTDKGEDEVYRRGKQLSWWYTYAGGGEVSFFAGVTTAKRLSSWVQVQKTTTQNTYQVNLVSGGREKVSLDSGETLLGETWHVYLGEDLEAILRKYGSSLSTRRSTKPVKTPVGWNSWYDLWSGVKETDIVESGKTRNADLVLTVLGSRIPASHKPMAVVLDDGWEKAWGDWTPNGKFPSGIDALAAKVSDMGLRFGIWIAPFLVSDEAPVYKNHPDWLVKNADGTIMNYSHPAHWFEKLAILDVTHEDAAGHLKELIEKLVGWGVQFLKIDFLFAGTWEGKRAEDVTGFEAYERGLEIIRNAAGDHMEILAVGAPPLPTFEYVDGWRMGCDIAFEPFLGISNLGMDFIANEARFFTSRWPLCLATLCDADPPLLRELPEKQVDLGAWVAVATGGALFLSDDLTKLPVERRDWGLDAQKIAIGIGGEPAVPETFFPDEIPVELRNMNDRNNAFYGIPFRVPNVWRMPGGLRVGLNFSDEAITIDGVNVPKNSAKEL